MARRQFFREIDVVEEWLGLGRPALRRAVPWLIATGVLGLIFVVGQWVAWKQMWTDRASLAFDPARYFFYLITGFHGGHLVVGILALMSALASLAFLRRVEYRRRPDRRGLHGVVLALHGPVLDRVVRSAGLRAVKLRVRYSFLVLLLGVLTCLPLQARAQGCSMCRDAAAGSSPRVRQSLRRAIPILGVPATALFLGMLGVAFRLNRPAQD